MKQLNILKEIYEQLKQRQKRQILDLAVGDNTGLVREGDRPNWVPPRVVQGRSPVSEVRDIMTINL